MGIRIEDINWEPVNPLDRDKWFGSEAVGATAKSAETKELTEEPTRAMASLAAAGADVQGSAEALRTHFGLESDHRDGEGPPDEADFARLPASPNRPPSRDALRQPMGGAALAFA